jgi:DNA-binding LacI/PurR family transcriptional regulator
MVNERMVDLGFTPNLNAQRLSHGRTNLVAIDFGGRRDYLADLFFVEIARVIQDELDRRGYGVLLSGPGDVLTRWVKPQAVDGVILVGVLPGGVTPDEIAEAGTPCAVISNEPHGPTPGVGSIVVGLESGARQVARLLADHGHRDIAFIGSDRPDPVLSAFRVSLEALGIPLLEERVAMTDASPRAGARAICDLLRQPHPPTAVFARTDALAGGVLRAAHQMGLQLPGDLSIVGHDDVPFCELTEPPLTTVRIDCGEIARLAANVLLSLLDDQTAAPPPVTVETRLVLRSSVCAQWRISPAPTQGRDEGLPHRDACDGG